MKHIRYNEKTQTFCLHTEHTVYAFCVNELGALEHLYYGAKLGDDDLRYMRRRHEYSFAPYKEEVGVGVSPAVFESEYCSGNGGDFRVAPFEMTDGKGRFGARLRYDGYEMRKGRNAIAFLPHSRGADAESLTVKLVGERKAVAVYLHYIVYAACDAITRYVEVVNYGEETVTLDRVASLCLDFEGHAFDLVETVGTYQFERGRVSRVPLRYGRQGNGSRKGASGHDGNPFFCLCAHDATETSGDAYGFNFIYSGNYCNEIEVDERGNTRAVTGLSGDRFAYPLGCGERFISPEAVLVYSDRGLGGMSRCMHAFVRQQILPEKWATAHRPIVLNTWEGHYFDIDEHKLLALADSALETGTELLVLDDGWFRSNDDHGLGDWELDGARFPSGLKTLSKKLHEKGLGFGLWFEPEMVSKESALYALHPDWTVSNGDEQYVGRNQLVLDLSHKEVVDYLFERIASVLDGVQFEYIKWDFNRYMTESGSAVGANGAFMYRYYIGLYDLLSRVRARFPDVLIETCAGGGGRFDLGMLFYSPQIWTSDNTDPYLRARVQWGTSLGYPPCTMASHVTENHNSGLNAALPFRAAVASFGCFGFELDPCATKVNERRHLKTCAERYVADEGLMLCGDLYRLLSDEKFVAYMLVSPDRARAKLTFIQFYYSALDQTVVIKAQGLDENATYRVTFDPAPSNAPLPTTLSGATLMRLGLRIPDLPGKAGFVQTIYLNRV